VSRRYGRAQFLRDAIWMGLPPEDAFSRAELRARRDRLMIIHHPDVGGDVEDAARINATYARMIAWLDNRSAGEAERKNAKVAADGAPEEDAGLYRQTLSAAFHAGAAQICAVALVALATYAALRGNRKV
jgi:hypothetical protein